MAITIKYFGAIAEAAGVSEEKVTIEEVGSSVEQLRSFCLNKYEAVGDLSFQLAVNQSLIASGTLNDGDEVAFLPPFAGG
ncbi:MoaD/ThiS family protein [Ekhidna sp. To15]|uniref:MoaD/ThiS family protein n=1 Tax=Ekhidna sp. To15 TaxID=3395267 RepID=UPI003F52617F